METQQSEILSQKVKSLCVYLSMGQALLLTQSGAGEQAVNSDLSVTGMGRHQRLSQGALAASERPGPAVGGGPHGPPDTSALQAAIIARLQSALPRTRQ